MGKDCDEFICSKDDTSLLEQIYSKGSNGDTLSLSKNDPSLKFKYKGPLNSVFLGKHTWPVLHAITLRFPESPSTEDQDRFLKFISAFSKTYPCSFCAEDFRKQIDITPPKLDSRKDLALWLCDQHNRVNKKLGKPEFVCSYGKLIALYGPSKRKANEIL